MPPKLIEDWHQLVQNKDLSILDKILAEDVTFYSPVVHTPQQGKFITKMYLSAAAMVLGNEHFKYLRETYADDHAILEFETELDGIVINGIDMISWNAENQIVEFKVMVRPLKAINKVHEMMGAMLKAQAPK
jgi:hypothetical protein